MTFPSEARGKFLSRLLSWLDNLVHRVTLAAHLFFPKEQSNEQRWRRAFGRSRRLGVRQHALDHFVLERSPLDLVDDCSRHFQLVLRCLLRVDEVSFVRPK